MGEQKDIKDGKPRKSRGPSLERCGPSDESPLAVSPPPNGAGIISSCSMFFRVKRKRELEKKGKEKSNYFERKESRKRERGEKY